MLDIAIFCTGLIVGLIIINLCIDQIFIYFMGQSMIFKFGYFLSNIDQMFLGYLIDYKILTLLLLLVFYEFFGIVFIVMPLVYFVNIYFVNKLKGKN